MEDLSQHDASGTDIEINTSKIEQCTNASFKRASFINKKETEDFGFIKNKKVRLNIVE